MLNYIWFAVCASSMLWFADCAACGRMEWYLGLFLSAVSCGGMFLAASK